ncbi:Methyltransferase nsun6, partial [Globisporangium splendens]
MSSNSNDAAANVHLDDFAVSFPAQVEDEFAAAYGAAHWEKIKHALATPTGYTAVRVNTMRWTREEALVGLRAALAEFNERLVQETQRSAVEPCVHPLLSDVIVIPSAPRMQPQVEYNTDMKSIIVDRLCGEAVLRGSDIYARGIMSASSGINAEDRVNVFVDLDHSNTRGSHADEHAGRKLLIAHGTTKMARTEMFRAQRGLAVTSLVRVCSDAPSMNGVLNGKVYIQNLPSTVVAHVLNPQEGECIIDMCSAPGGKSSHVATLMKNKGILVACDRSKRKALELQKLFAELEYDSVVPLKMDSTHSVLPQTDGPILSVREVIERARQTTPAKAHLLQIDGFYPETFDKVLLDPPCSALGLRPRLLHAGDADNLAEYASMQRNFLWAAVYLLKPGGTLVYSTCTINPKENEQMVRHALDNYPLMLEPQSVHIGDTGLLNQGLSAEEAALVQRFDPSNSDLDTMGFFCAKFTKTKSIREPASASAVEEARS